LSGTLVISNEITEIGSGTFNSSDIEDVKFEKNSQLTKIGANAFQYANMLESIEIPAGVEEIGDYAFYATTSLINMEFKGTVEEWDEVEKIDSWVDFSDGAFNIIDVVCSDGLSPLLEPGLYDASGTLLHSWDYLYSYGYVSAEDGHLMQYDSTLVGDYLVISNEVTSIDGMAFEGTQVKKIGLPSSVTTIDNYAFSNANFLSGTFIIPASVTYIGNVVFSETSIYQIKYKGTMEEWNQINKSSSFGAELSFNTVICFDGEVTFDN
jgi:hypothetical protein